jgi:hypothetical protein
MAIDMMILSNKRQKAIAAATTMRCPQCAELIKREAKVCRFCGVDLTVGTEAPSIDSAVVQADTRVLHQDTLQASVASEPFAAESASRRSAFSEPRATEATSESAENRAAGDASLGTSGNDSLPPDAVQTFTEPWWHFSRAPVVIAVTVVLLCLIVGGGIWLSNYQSVGRPLTRVLTSDPRNAGISASAHFGGYVNRPVLVFDLQTVSGTNRPMDVFRVLLQFSAEMKQRRFTRVELTHRGQIKFFIAGDYFEQLGNEYSEQNPVYTMRTFPEHLFMPDGSRAYETWSGGLLGVLSKQMEDFNDFHRKWYLNDIVASMNPSIGATTAETTAVPNPADSSASTTEAHGVSVEASAAPPIAPTETTQIPATENTEPLRSVGISPPFEPTPKANVAPPAKVAPAYVMSQVYIADGLYYREDCEHPARAVRTPKAMAIQQGYRPAPNCYQPTQTTTGQP